MSMGIFTSMMALVGSGVGCAVSHAGDKAKREWERFKKRV